jgi:CHAT domain-containing protein
LPSGEKFLVEEKTVSYVTSGREIVRIANPGGQEDSAHMPPQEGDAGGLGSGRSLVIGNPDFDLDLVTLRLTNGPSLAADGSPNGASLSRASLGLRFEPIHGAETEAREVAALLGKDTDLKLGSEAREAVLKAARSPRVLHLATHGFFLPRQQKLANQPWDPNAPRPAFRAAALEDPDNPLMRCGVALAGANRGQGVTNAVFEDGLLTGLEASLLNLQGTKLVILSACQSSVGEVNIGEGVMSLRRAFRIAGAETVLASHWSVSDKATSRLMTEFIRRWLAGEPRAMAWREAQLSLIRTKGAEEDFSNPYFWAAFTLTGQWR